MSGYLNVINNDTSIINSLQICHIAVIGGGCSVFRSWEDTPEKFQTAPGDCASPAVSYTYLSVGELLTYCSQEHETDIYPWTDWGHQHRRSNWLYTWSPPERPINISVLQKLDQWLTIYSRPEKFLQSWIQFQEDHKRSLTPPKNNNFDSLWRRQ